MPEFTSLAFSSAVDPLRIANQLAQKPLCQWEVLSRDGGPVRSSSGIEVGADRCLSELDRNAYVLVCSGNRGNTAASDTTLSELRRHNRMGGKSGGICTGAMTLARAGILGKGRFTLHWENQPAFLESFHDLVPTSRRHETESGVLTCGGGATVLSPRNPRFVQIVREMHETIENPRSLDILARNAGYSRRQVERKFKQVFGETPLTVYRNIRLDRARSMFAETNMTVIEVAVACGFAQDSAFSKHYKARFGVSPSAIGNHGDRRPSSSIEGRKLSV